MKTGSMNSLLQDQFNTLRQVFDEQVLPRYQQLESREQKIVLAAAVLLPLMMIVFGLMLPLQDRQRALQQELSVVQGQSAEADQLAAYLMKHGAQSGLSKRTESLLSTVEQIARQTHVRRFMTRIKPQVSPGGGAQRLMLRIKDAPYDAMLRFVQALAKRELGLKSLKFQAAKTPGYVHVNAIIIGA